jgi:hypothetical protein
MMRRLIAFTGPAGCGKSTAAEYLATKHGFEQYGFSFPLKELVGDLFDFSDEQLYGPSHCRNEPDARYPRADGTCLSPREALQKFGTDAARSCYPDIWVDACMRYVDDVLESIGDPAGLPGICLMDLRFDNEARAVRARGGIVVKLHRTAGGIQGSMAQHSSEAGVHDSLVDQHISNHGEKSALFAELDYLIRNV